ncbi:tRNA (adenosine(37)-N6)-threonylcarbamoyltransferase complex ATPase subunit type 1 TsaE [Candidatus Saccharibacteria bacterium]|nr:tRNA (adenosine(37)-N6)-threonylcarbamoyltransferase complex ATPase subunit type 1 TsaE [Candidatus Saccharibacteria bacterium]MBH1973419.1 tRNA (adenosine(37)-N6)-threonylcarbamoyltransferase complex ATPase subunit type 1 TsaE [Candidatus Saccharibacteria bacterium]MBH1990340.1 tRNA (adenosine(37)-N6)-threonylcarbamoyltransferase complex ATPase subunit type 1 TsaE [Candidatus Saccharibacteria bacterium]
MKQITTEVAMKEFGQQLGRILRGGEVIELIGDVGAGKTTFTKGLAIGMGIDEVVQSPSFTISRTYENAESIRMVHYDFYRLHDAGVMKQDLQESIEDDKTVTVVEWADIVSGVLPDDRLSLRFTSPTETSRSVDIKAGGSRSDQLKGEII